MAGVVIIGAGPAGVRCAERLSRRGVDVTLIGAEVGAPYNRVALSQFLAGDLDEAALVTHTDRQLAELRVTHRPGTRVAAIERAAKRLLLADGAHIPYDTLVLALGAEPVRLRLPGADLPGVLAYRTLDDVRAMIAAAHTGGAAVVIGGGLLGLEAAAGLARRGMRVTVVHAVGRLMERQLDDPAARLLRQRLADQGVMTVLGAASSAIEGADRVEAVRLSDGRRIAADLVVVAVGIRPNAGLAQEAGLQVGRGVVVDAAMRTSDPDVLAIGECAEVDGQCCGLVAPALAQAEVAARTILGEAAQYAPASDATALKVAGAGVWSAGAVEADGAEPIVLHDADAGQYRRLLVRDGRLVGAMLYGETADAPWYLDLIATRRDLGAMRAALAFGPAAEAHA